MSDGHEFNFLVFVIGVFFLYSYYFVYCYSVALVKQTISYNKNQLLLPLLLRQSPFLVVFPPLTLNQQQRAPSTQGTVSYSCSKFPRNPVSSCLFTKYEVQR